MYTKGWGLLVDWKCFLEAAFTWQTLRGLRLSRKRHAAELQSGHARVNLASLPQEVMNTIEAYVMASTPKRVRSRAPFKFKSDCCQKAMEAFRDSDELWDAYEEFRDSEDRDVSGYRFVKGFSKYLWQDFEISSEWEELETEWMADHRRSDCFIATSQHNFWTRFTTKEKQGRIRNHIRQLLYKSDEAVKVFAEDHHLTLFPILSTTGITRPTCKAAVLVNISRSSIWNTASTRSTRSQQKQASGPPKSRVFESLMESGIFRSSVDTKGRRKQIRGLKILTLEPRKIPKLTWNLVDEQNAASPV